MNFQSASVGGWAVAAAVSVLAVPSTSFGQAVQWRVSDGGNGHWYRLRAEGSGLTWDQAAARCGEQGGHLATLLSEAEDIFAFGVADNPLAWNGALGPWLGARQVPGTGEPLGFWEWITGEPWGYVGPDKTFPNNGGPNPPPGVDENRLHYIDGIRRWNDIPESGFGGVKTYIIEWSADCNNDGISDYGQCRDGSLPDYNLNNIPDCCEDGIPCVVGTYPVQWRVEDGGNGHWYERVTLANEVTWSDANAAAVSRAGHLVTLTSAAEQAWVEANFISGHPTCSPASWATPRAIWIGLFQDTASPSYSEPSGGWRWVTDEPFAYSNWSLSEPNNVDTPANFAGVYGNGLWDDTKNDSGIYCHRGYVIEWSDDCNNDGISDYGQVLSGALVDADDNGVPDLCEDPCPGDVNSSGVVNATDISIILGAWGTNGGKFPRSDANGDGVVDAADLAIVLGGWGPCP